MEEQAVAAVLANDVQANFEYIQLAAFIVSSALAIIGLTLSARAYATLNEARILMSDARRTQSHRGQSASGRVATAQRIQASTTSRPVAAKRKSVV